MDPIYDILNRLVFERLSLLLNSDDIPITEEAVSELTERFGMSIDEAFSYLFAAAIGIDPFAKGFETRVFREYFPHMLHRLDEGLFVNDAFYVRAKDIPERERDGWSIKKTTIKPYTPFVCDDPLVLLDGRIIPQIGYFDTEYENLGVYQDGREWMTLLPNELTTQKKHIAKAHGRVLTYGLGLGYFAFSAASKPEVGSVTVVERDERAISLFETEIAPQLGNTTEKIGIVCADAFEFAEKEAPGMDFDYIFADIWHDPSDGVEAYKRFRALEPLCKNSEFGYWIEETLKLYM